MIDAWRRWLAVLVQAINDSHTDGDENQAGNPTHEERQYGAPNTLSGAIHRGKIVLTRKKAGAPVDCA